MLILWRKKKKVRDTDIYHKGFEILQAVPSRLYFCCKWRKVESGNGDEVRWLEMFSLNMQQGKSVEHLGWVLKFVFWRLNDKHSVQRGSLVATKHLLKDLQKP